MPLSGYQKGQLFHAQGHTLDHRHQAIMTGIGLDSLKASLATSQAMLEAKKREHEYEQARLDINRSLDAPDEDDDRNIRPAYHGTREQQLEAQIVMLEKVGERTAEKTGMGVGLILGILAIVVAALNWNKAY